MTSFTMAANEKVYAMAGYSLNVPAGTNALLKTFC
jgi:cytochrome b involved in lipid metabolism